MTKIMIDRDLLERIGELMHIIAHRQDDYGVEAEYLGNILSKVLANSAQRIVVESVPAGCKVVPVELLERAALLLQDSLTPPAGCSDFDDWTEQGNAVATELRAMVASTAPKVKDE